MSKQEVIEIQYDPEVSPELKAYEFLQSVGYEVCINRFDMMEESDWVVMRCLFGRKEELARARAYLIDKYGEKTYLQCLAKLFSER